MHFRLSCIYVIIVNTIFNEMKHRIMNDVRSREFVYYKESLLDADKIISHKQGSYDNHNSNGG